MMMISQFNGTSTPKGSYSAKAGVNYMYAMNVDVINGVSTELHVHLSYMGSS